MLFEQEVTINFPNVGQLIQIESNKQLLAAGAYGSLVNARTRQANLTLDLIDAIATFMVMVPDFRENKAFPSDLDKLSPTDMVRLVSPFKTQFFPWFNKILKDIENQLQAATQLLNEAEEDLS